MTRASRARAAGLNVSTVNVRIHRGWDEEFALEPYSRERIDKMQTQRERRRDRYEAGICAACGMEPRGEGVLGEACRERNNRARLKPGIPGWPKGKPRGASNRVRIYNRAETLADDNLKPWTEAAYQAWKESA